MIFFALIPSQNLHMPLHILNVVLVSHMARQPPTFPVAFLSGAFPGGPRSKRGGFFTLSRQAHKAEPKNTTAAVRRFVSVIKPSAVKDVTSPHESTHAATPFRSKV